MKKLFVISALVLSISMIGQPLLAEEATATPSQATTTEQASSTPLINDQASSTPTSTAIDTTASSTSDVNATSTQPVITTPVEIVATTSLPVVGTTTPVAPTLVSTSTSVATETPVTASVAGYSFTMTASSTPSPGVVNQPITITTNVTNTGSSYTGAIVDTEIYANNGAGARVFQNAVDLGQQAFNNGEVKSFNSTWTPTQTGTYQIRVGVFGANWNPLFSWTDIAAGLVVGTTTNGTTTPPNGTSTDESSCGRPGTNNFNACYYSGTNRDVFKLHRTDNAINFDWGQGSPDPSVPSDNFSARWLGLFNFDNAEYEFTVRTDDGIRLNVDNQTILDKYFDQPATTYKVRKVMPAGQRGVIVEYYEHTGDAVAQVSWTKVGDATSTPTTTPQNTFQAKYYDNPDFTNLKVTRNETSINNDWGYGSPDPSIQPDTFSAIWEGDFDFTRNNYTFSLSHDDGARLFIDGQKVIDKWFDQAVTTDTASVPLTRGSHHIKMEYYENTGQAVAKLNWAVGTSTGTTTPGDNNVSVSSTRQDASSIPQGGTNTFFAQLQSPNTTNTVLVDLELYNSNGQKVAQKFTDNVTIQKGETPTFQLSTPANLPAGNYYWSVGIFKPGWTDLIKWYHAPQSFTVGGQSGGGNVTLKGSALGESHLNNCPPITALLQNQSSSAKSVLVDFELRNSSGNLVNQYFVDNYSVPPTGNSTVSLTNVCNTTLPNGQYTYSIGIFNPGWSSLINWYQATQTFSK